MAPLTFTATIQINGANPYVLVNGSQARQLQPNWRKPMPVRVQINGQPQPAWRINMMPIGDGSYYLYLHEIVRKASRTKVGDQVQVSVSFDESYSSGPQDTMPSWFEAALDSNIIAAKNWLLLPPSRQKEVLRYLGRLKSIAAQQRNLTQAMHVLSGKSGHYMGRDWTDGK